MDVKYLSDAKGAITGVFIPIEEWERLRKEYNLPLNEPAPASEQLQQRLTEALKKAKPST